MQAHRFLSYQMFSWGFSLGCTAGRQANRAAAETAETAAGSGRYSRTAVGQNGQQRDQEGGRVGLAVRVHRERVVGGEERMGGRIPRDRQRVTREAQSWKESI